jgi:uncharacterized protein (DUF1330 family)
MFGLHVFSQRGIESPLSNSASMIARNAVDFFGGGVLVSSIVLKAVYFLAMAVYVIVNVRIRDLAAYDAYKVGVAPLIGKHGGEYLARGGGMEVLEGDWVPSRVVLLKFPNMGAVRAFLDEPEYAPLKSLRHHIADTQMVAVEGV